MTYLESAFLGFDKLMSSFWGINAARLRNSPEFSLVLCSSSVVYSPCI